MMCSIEELEALAICIQKHQKTVFTFLMSKDVKPGDDAVAALGLRDAVVEFENYF